MRQKLWRTHSKSFKTSMNLHLSLVFRHVTFSIHSSLFRSTSREAPVEIPLVDSATPPLHMPMDWKAIKKRRPRFTTMPFCFLLVLLVFFILSIIITTQPASPGGALGQERYINGRAIKKYLHIPHEQGIRKIG